MRAFSRVAYFMGWVSEICFFKGKSTFVTNFSFSMQEYPWEIFQDAVFVFLPIRNQQSMDSVLKFLPMSSTSYIIHLTLYNLLTIHIHIKAFDVITFSIVVAFFWEVWFHGDSLFTMIIQFTNEVFWTMG